MMKPDVYGTQEVAYIHEFVVPGVSGIIRLTTFTTQKVGSIYGVTGILEVLVSIAPIVVIADSDRGNEAFQALARELDMSKSEKAVMGVNCETDAVSDWIGMAVSEAVTLEGHCRNAMAALVECADEQSLTVNPRSREFADTQFSYRHPIADKMWDR